MKRLLSFVICICLLALSVPAMAGEKLRVAVTIPPQAWLIDQIGSGLVETLTLVAPGADMHTFEPKPSQVIALAQADLYMTLDLEFEKAWLPRLTSANPSMRIVAMNAGVEKIALASAHVDAATATDGRSHGHYDDQEKLKAEARQWTHRHGTLDPHIWTEPANMLIMAKNTFEALQRADTANAKTYVENYFKVKKIIENLERELVGMFSAKYGANRTFMVFHPSWGYFARAYALTQVPIEVGGSEPSPREMVEIIAEAKENNIKVIFVQPSISTKAAKIVGAEIGASVTIADPLAYDWADNLRSVAQAMKSALN